MEIDLFIFSYRSQAIIDLGSYTMHNIHNNNNNNAFSYFGSDSFCNF